MAKKNRGKSASAGARSKAEDKLIKLLHKLCIPYSTREGGITIHFQPVEPTAEQLAAVTGFHTGWQEYYRYHGEVQFDESGKLKSCTCWDGMVPQVVHALRKPS